MEVDDQQGEPANCKENDADDQQGRNVLGVSRQRQEKTQGGEDDSQPNHEMLQSVLGVTARAATDCITLPFVDKHVNDRYDKEDEKNPSYNSFSGNV